MFDMSSILSLVEKTMILYTLMSFLGNSATYPKINGNILPDIYRFFCEGVSSYPSASGKKKKEIRWTS